MNAKDLYSELISKKWDNPHNFLQDVKSNTENIMWGPGGAGREFAYEILSKDMHWCWISYRIDDFAPLVEEDMRNKLSTWIWRANFGIGALSKRMYCTKAVSKWLMDRYVAMLKNLFDKRYKNSLSPSFIVEFDENYLYTKELI